MIFTPYCSYFTIGKHEDIYQPLSGACANRTSITWWVYIVKHYQTVILAWLVFFRVWVWVCQCACALAYLCLCPCVSVCVFVFMETNMRVCMRKIVWCLHVSSGIVYCHEWKNIQQLWHLYKQKQQNRCSWYDCSPMFLHKHHFRTTLYSIRLNIGQLFQHRNNSTSYLIVELYTNFALKAEMCIICDWFVRIVVKIFVITLFYRIWFCVSSIASNCTTCAHCYSFYHYDSQMHGNLIDECANSICWYVRPNEKQEGIFYLLNAHECEKCIRTENVQR